MEMEMEMILNVGKWLWNFECCGIGFEFWEMEMNDELKNKTKL